MQLGQPVPLACQLAVAVPTACSTNQSIVCSSSVPHQSPTAAGCGTLSPHCNMHTHPFCLSAHAVSQCVIHSCALHHLPPISGPDLMKCSHSRRESWVENMPENFTHTENQHQLHARPSWPHAMVDVGRQLQHDLEIRASSCRARRASESFTRSCYFRNCIARTSKPWSKEKWYKC